MTYYNPGEIYTFRCLNLEKSATRVITIVFDNNVNATVTFATNSINPLDKREFVFFAPENEYEIINHPTSSEINILGSLDKFWYLNFYEHGNPIQNATTIAGVGGSMTITCPCGQDTGDCTISKTGEGDCKKIHCDTTTTCTSCNPPKILTGFIESNKTFILIKTNNAQK